MAAAGIIVIAPDAAFRHSLVFVLESGGFRALPHGSLEAAFAQQRFNDAQCAVVDEEAVDSWLSAQFLFQGFARPVILLVGLPGVPPQAPLVRCLVKPFLGKPLLDAVQQAVAGKGGPAT